MNLTTSTNYSDDTAHKYPAKSRFVVERSCYLDLLNPSELQSIRTRDLSPPEVFHAPPKLYVYQERPDSVYLIERNRNDNVTCSGYLKKQKHTICAWTFGSIVVIVMTIIIVLQARNDFS